MGKNKNNKKQSIKIETCEDLINQLYEIRAKLIDVQTPNLIDEFGFKTEKLKKLLTENNDPKITIPGWVEYGFLCISNEVNMLFDDKKEFFHQKAEKAFVLAKKLLDETPSLNLPLYQWGIKSGLTSVVYATEYMKFFNLASQKTNKIDLSKTLKMNRTQMFFEHLTASDKTTQMMESYLRKNKETALNSLKKLSNAFNQNIFRSDLEELISLCNDEFKKDKDAFRNTMYAHTLMRYHEVGALFYSSFWERWKDYYEEGMPEVWKKLNSDVNNIEMMLESLEQYLSLLTIINSKFNDKIICFIAPFEAAAKLGYVKLISAQFKLEKVEEEVKLAKVEEEKNQFQQQSNSEEKILNIYLKSTKKKTKSSFTPKGPEKPDPKPTPNAPLTCEELAYQYFLNGKYSESIKAYNKLLPEGINIDNKNLVIAKNKIEGIKIIAEIGKCYTRWAEHSYREAKLAQQLNEKASAHFEYAEKFFEHILQLGELNDAETRECSLYLDYVKTILKQLNDDSEDESEDEKYFEKKRKPRKFKLEDFSKKKNQKWQPKKTNKSIPFELETNQATKIILNTFKEKNVKAYIVGGAVRDSILKIPPKDFDIVVNTDPENTKNLVKPHPAKIIGKTSPITQVNIKKEKVEISPLRCNESDNNNVVTVHLDNKKQSTYIPTDKIEEDALTRDFTINCAYVSDGLLHDPTGLAVSDIQQNIIRTVIDPLESFEEDPIRILRAVRFSVRLKFIIEEKTELAIKSKASLLVEDCDFNRVNTELKKIFHTNGLEALTKLHDLGLLSIIFPLADDYYFNKKSVLYQTIINQTICTLENYWKRRQLSETHLFLAILNSGPILEKISEAKEWHKAIAHDQITLVVNHVIANLESQLDLTKLLTEKMRKLWISYLDARFYHKKDEDLGFESYADYNAFAHFKKLMQETDKQLVKYQSADTLWTKRGNKNIANDAQGKQEIANKLQPNL